MPKPAPRFRAYADANPDDPDLVRRRSTGSAISPLCSRIIPPRSVPSPNRSKNIPTSSRSPDSMLKLGQSLLATARPAEVAPPLPRSRPNIPSLRLDPRGGGRRAQSLLQQISSKSAFAAAMDRLAMARRQNLAGRGGGVGRRRFARPDASSGAMGAGAKGAAPLVLSVDHGLAAGKRPGRQNSRALGQKRRPEARKS